jgi:hypothetical protein
VYVGSDSGLGAIASSTYVETGATLSLYLGITLAETLFIEGGTLENFISDNTVTGDVTFSPSGKVSVFADTTLTLDGIVSGGLTKQGAGTLVMSDLVANALVVDAGVVEATGNSIGTVVVDAGGTFVGSGTQTGPLVVYASGTLGTGTRATPGTLLGALMQWKPDGYFRARLGKKSDKLVLSGSLAKFDPGFARFIFADGVTPPVQGVEYTLVEYSVQSGLDGALTYTYEGTGPGASLTGTLNVGATKITFTVTSVVSDLVFRDGIEP